MDYRVGGEEVASFLLICGGFFLVGAFVGFVTGIGWTSHEQGVRDALAGKYVIVELPDGSSVVVKNKEAQVNP
jgi:hypothetical protein